MNEMSFEEGLTKLNELVSSLERGNATLDESIKNYEEAIELISECNKKILEAESKIKVLTDSEIKGNN